jgi:hypothetical protein
MTSPKYLTPEDLVFGLEEDRIYIEGVGPPWMREMHFLGYEYGCGNKNGITIWAHFKTTGGAKDFCVYNDITGIIDRHRVFRKK